MRTVLLRCCELFVLSSPIIFHFCKWMGGCVSSPRESIQMRITYGNNSNTSPFVFRVGVVVTDSQYSSVNTDIEFSPTPRTKESTTAEEIVPGLRVA